MPLWDEKAEAETREGATHALGPAVPPANPAVLAGTTYATVRGQGGTQFQQRTTEPQRSMPRTWPHYTLVSVNVG